MLNVELPYLPAIVLLGIQSKRTENMSTQNLVHECTAAIFTVVKREKQHKCLSADEWMSKMWSNRAVRYYLAIKRNEVLRHAATRRNLENI